MLWSAIHAFLSKKQLRTTDDECDFSDAVGLLARWNGFKVINPAHLVPDNLIPNGRLQLGQGLVAEKSVSASENYIVLKRLSSKKETQKYPPFVEEDSSWYQALEDRINDNLDRWEENASKRRQQRLKSAKQGIQRLLDGVQAPAARFFGVVTERLGPVVDRIRATMKPNLKQVYPLANNYIPDDSALSSQGHLLPENTRSSDQDESEPTTSKHSFIENACNQNETDPEDIIILSKGGDSLTFLNYVDPAHRLLALPVATIDGKVKPPYRLRLARGGLVITVSIIVLGALPPTYRSLRFILEYPKTAEFVMMTLVASVAYNLWSWRSNARTRQRELIAAAIQSRLVARDEAALSFLTISAVETLTDALMESYVSLILSPKAKKSIDDMDPLVAEIGESVGLFRRHKKQPSERLEEEWEDHPSEQIVAEEWEKARKALVHSLAVRM